MATQNNNLFRQNSWHRSGRNWLAFLICVGPAVLIFSAMMLWPLVDMFRVSLFEWRRLTSPKTFIGLANYVRLFNDPKILVALKNTLLHMFVMLAVIMPISFMLGFFLSQRLRGYRLLRTIFFSPVMLSAPALALIFLGIYLPDGILNYVLRSVGLENLTRVWLANPSTSLPAVIGADAWGAVGFYTVLFFVALSDLPQEIFESAQLDGASYWVMMWRIGFPLVLDFFGVALTLNFVWTLTGSAQYVLLLTKGGPGTSSLTLSYYLYDKAFLSYRIGYSQAIGVLLFFAGMIGMLFIRRVTQRSYLGE
jgi:multiple sugar transport system permease protein